MAWSRSALSGHPVEAGLLPIRQVPKRKPQSANPKAQTVRAYTRRKHQAQTVRASYGYTLGLYGKPSAFTAVHQAARRA